MSEPVNPYSSPTSPPGEVVARPWPPPRLDNPFADVFVTGTRLLFRNFVLVTTIVLTVWIPINLWVSYYELFVIGEDDFGRYFRMVRLMEGLFGVLGVGAVTAVGAVDLSGQTPSYRRAFGESLSQWGNFVLGGIAGNFLLLFGLLCFVIPGLIVIAALTWLAPVLIVERLSITESLQQCLAVAKRRFWFSLGLALAVTVLHLVAGLASGLVAVGFSLLEPPEGVYWLINAAVSLPTDLVGAWCSLILVAAYLRLREETKSEPVESYVPSSTPTGTMEQS